MTKVKRLCTRNTIKHLSRRRMHAQGFGRLTIALCLGSIFAYSLHDNRGTKERSPPSLHNRLNPFYRACHGFRATPTWGSHTARASGRPECQGLSW
jgi:hypothetical protein